MAKNKKNQADSEELKNLKKQLGLDQNQPESDQSSNSGSESESDSQIP